MRGISSEQPSHAEATRPVAEGVGLRIVLGPPYRHELGHCWLVSLDNHADAASLTAVADEASASRRSTAWLHEDGVPLGPAHAAHAAIREVGNGAFSHWKDTLYFSTSDNTDPNLNGRVYALAISDGRKDGTGDAAEQQQASQLTLRGHYVVLQNLALCQHDKGSAPDPADLQKQIRVIERKIVENSGRFDEAFYRRSYGAVIPDGCSALDHFLAVGYEQGLLPSSRFDPVLYKILHPLRRHPNPLIDSILESDHDDYRDVSALFRDLRAEDMPIAIRYPAALQTEWAASAHSIVRNRDQPVHIRAANFKFKLLNPDPDLLFSRFVEGRPFCFARLPHGLWDHLAAMRRLTQRLRGTRRCAHLSERELFHLSDRLLGSSRMLTGNPCYENYQAELVADLMDNPRNDSFWTAISLTGAPTPDGLGDFDLDDVKDRASLLASFFTPSDVLYDATLWKRWALSGDIVRLPDAVRSHDVILVAARHFGSLARKWRLSSFRHVAIPEDHVYLFRQDLLEALSSMLAEQCGRRPLRCPVVIFQCGGDLSYWLMRRLRLRHPKVFYLDIGQALDLWHWRLDWPWARIYGEAILAANSAVIDLTDEANMPVRQPDVTIATLEEAMAVLRADYLETGLAGSSGELLLTLAGTFVSEGTNGWQMALPPELNCLTDNGEAPRRSPLLLLENGKALGHGHDQHSEISNWGQGLYSFWKGVLYFSTSDNTDPRFNGRTYQVALRVDRLAGESTISDEIMK